MWAQRIKNYNNFDNKSTIRYNMPVKRKSFYKVAHKIFNNLAKESVMVEHPSVDDTFSEDSPYDFLTGLPDDENTDKEFLNKVKILNIDSPKIRMMCYFLGVIDNNRLKRQIFSTNTLIGMLHSEQIQPFMEKRHFKLLGKINFDSHGILTPCIEGSWTLNDKATIFTKDGYLFFRSEKNEDTIIIRVGDNNGYDDNYQIECVGTDSNHCKFIIDELQKHTLANNFLKTAKIHDVCFYEGTFIDVAAPKDKTWENYYYKQDIVDLFSLEIFSFLKNIEYYNKRGINKRGFLMDSRPGAGKSSLCYILCNNLPNHGVIWITPDMVRESGLRGKMAINSLYKLAAYISPCVMILEDIDLFTEDREGPVDALQLGSLMNILDGVNNVHNVITVATTNRIDMIEKALRNRPGRFDRIVDIPDMSNDLRKKIFTNRLQNYVVSDEMISYIVSKTDGYNGAEAQELVNSINLHFINNSDGEIKDGAKLEITREIVDNVLKHMKRFGIMKKGGEGKKAGFAAGMDD